MLRDKDIRAVLKKELLTIHGDEPNTLVVEEFGCKAARADLAVINGVMHCYEIKSGADRLSRLRNQVPAYSAVFDRVTIVVEVNHLTNAEDIIPSWWGIKTVKLDKQQVVLRDRRKGSVNRKQDPFSLAMMLWKDEADRVAREHHLNSGKPSVIEQWQALAGGLPLHLLAASVRRAIVSRGGSGFRQPLKQSDDSCPRQSIFQDYLFHLQDQQ